MNAKLFFRTACFLIILFLAVYVGIQNTKVIEFNFPLVSDKPLHASAAIVYFAMFAVGVVGGTLLHNSGDGGGKKK